MKKVPEELATKLNAVADSFLARGDDARLDQLAEEIGVPRATLYYHFSGKDDLTTFFMQDKLGRVGVRVQEARNGDGSAIERFEAALAATVGELCLNPSLCLQLTAAQGRPAAMVEVMRAMDLAVMSPLRELLIEARAVGDADVLDIDLAVSAALGAVNRAVLHRFATKSEVDADSTSEATVSLVLNGLRIRD